MGVLDGFTLKGYIAAAVVTYYIGLFGYRLLLHPLSRYPGPLVAKITDGYGGLYALKRELHLKTWEDHQRFGSVIRQGPNKLVFNSLQAVRDIYLNEGISKSLCYEAGNVNPTTTNVFNTIDKRVHRFKRKLVGQIVTDRSIRTFESKLSDHVDVFIAQIQRDTESLINMSERCKYLGLDISGYLGFGYALNLQSEEIYRYLVRAMMIGSWRLNLYMQFPFLRKLRLEILFYLLAVVQGKSFLKTLSMMIQSRLAKDKKAEHDLYAHMAEALDAPQEDRITASEIWTEGIFFLPAAGDTTSTALSSLFYYLARNPTYRHKLAAEIRSSFTSPAEIGGSRLTGCRLLRACINESLRMSPPVPGTMWRQRLASDGDQPLIVDGHVIPPGTSVGVDIYALHHNPQYFPDPFTWNPDRWLSPKTDASEAGPSHNGDESDDDTEASTSEPGGLAINPAFIPFSLGSRGCAGKALAYAEVGMAMARTLWSFDFEFANPEAGQGPEFRLYDVFTSTHDGPYLKFTPRP
ncbi:benzoate 4-monooxygenase cytochrome P450 [Xylariaceae sp. FL1272]|nr:benzoate 4-monooxygenase cytochrome P450 [Xylariaceae sp. FL1272]